MYDCSSASSHWVYRWHLPRLLLPLHPAPTVVLVGADQTILFLLHITMQNHLQILCWLVKSPCECTQYKATHYNTDIWG